LGGNSESPIGNNLDIFWLKDDSFDDPDLLPPPDEIAAEIVESLETALVLPHRAGRLPPLMGVTWGGSIALQIAMQITKSSE